MNKNIIVIVSSAALSLVLFWMSRVLVGTCDAGLACVGQSVFLFILYLLIPLIVFGVIGYRWGEKRGFKQSLKFMGISLLIGIILVIPFFVGNKMESNRRTAEDLEQERQNYLAHPEQYKMPPPGVTQ